VTRTSAALLLVALLAACAGTVPPPAKPPAASGTTSRRPPETGSTAFVVWDEYTPMPNVIIAPSVRPGTVVSMPVNHFALLRTTEELLGLPVILGAAASAPSLRPAFGT